MKVQETKKQFKYKGEEIKAFCYLYKDKDEANKCLLTDQHFFILTKKTEFSFPLHQIVNIQLTTKYTMLPLIAGGIVLPLSLIAIFSNLYDQWISIYIMLIGALSLYKGWIGHQVISIFQKGSIVDTVPLKNVSEPLKSFIKFTNEIIKMGIKDEIKAPHIYHIVDRKEWEHHKAFRSYTPASIKKEGFIHCSQKEQLEATIQRFFKGKSDLMILHINPLKVKAEIKYEAAKDATGLFPHIYGPLNIDAIVKEEPRE